MSGRNSLLPLLVAQVLAANSAPREALAPAAQPRKRRPRVDFENTHMGRLYALMQPGVAYEFRALRQLMPQSPKPVKPAVHGLVAAGLVRKSGVGGRFRYSRMEA